MILRRIEITLTGPDGYPEEDADAYQEWHAEERRAMFLFADHVRILMRQLQAELPDEYDVEIEG